MTALLVSGVMCKLHFESNFSSTDKVSLIYVYCNQAFEKRVKSFAKMSTFVNCCEFSDYSFEKLHHGSKIGDIKFLQNTQWEYIKGNISKSNCN